MPSFLSGSIEGVNVEINVVPGMGREGLDSTPLEMLKTFGGFES